MKTCGPATASKLHGPGTWREAASGGKHLPGVMQHDAAAKPCEESARADPGYWRVHEVASGAGGNAHDDQGCDLEQVRPHPAEEGSVACGEGSGDEGSESAGEGYARREASEERAEGSCVAANGGAGCGGVPQDWGCGASFQGETPISVVVCHCADTHEQNAPACRMCSSSRCCEQDAYSFSAVRPHSLDPLPPSR